MQSVTRPLSGSSQRQLSLIHSNAPRYGDIARLGRRLCGAFALERVPQDPAIADRSIALLVVDFIYLAPTHPPGPPHVLLHVNASDVQQDAK